MMLMVVDTAVTVMVNYAALVDDTDFRTREESVTFDQSGLDLVWNFVTPAGVITQTAVTPTDTAGVYDWTSLGNGMYKIEIPASGGGTINNDTEGYGWFSGFATGILPWVGPIVTFTPAHVVNGLVTGSDNLQVDTTLWNSVALGTTNPLPNAAADTAGGLVISDAGGLDIDAMNTAAIRLTAVRAAILTDWINDGRLDAILDAVKLKTDLLATASVTSSGPVSSTSSIEIVRGDDYSNDDSRSLEWTNAAGTWPDLTGATIDFGATRTGETNFTGGTGSVIDASPGSSQKVRVEFTDAETMIEPGVWSYDVQATLSSGNIITLVSGKNKMTVLAENV